MLRLAGTIPGCLAGLAILSFAPQSRWLFALLACGWIFFTTAMMLHSKNSSYFWNVAGFVCLIITVTGPGSSENLFEHAVFRTVETAMGVVVYTLITVFLWPRTNAGAIRKAGGELVATQRERIRTGRDAMIDRGEPTKLQELPTREAQQLGQFAQALQAEGSESYEVHELRHLWERRSDISGALREAIDRWQTGFAEIARIDVDSVLPDLPAFFAELDARFEAIHRVLGGGLSEHEPKTVYPRFDRAALHKLSALDRAALAVTGTQLKNLDALTAAMLDCSRAITGESTDSGASRPLPPHGDESRSLGLPVFDLDHLRGATFAAITVGVGILIWFFFNPPGHAGWFQFSGSLAMAVAGTQQLKTSSFIKPVGLASVIILAAYVFIMPQLSTFAGLGSLIFLCMFINCFFFKGFAQLAGTIGILNEISVQNQQTYDFAAMANAFVFTLLGFMFVFAMSYMLRSPRPEKAVLHLLGRFFHAAEFLVSQVTLEQKRTPTLLTRWKTAFYVNEVRSLPNKVTAWGRAIDRTLFPDTSPEQVQALTASLGALGGRIDELLDASEGGQAGSLARAMDEDLRTWQAGIESTFDTWSTSPGASPADLENRIQAGLTGLEQQIDEVLEQTDPATLNDRDGENFYRLLGGFRGVSEAALAYTGAAASIDWAQWREEVFQ